MYYPPKGREKEIPRRHSSPPRHSSRPSHSKASRYSKADDHKEKPKSSSRWKENLTAAGIGGAAVSLLNVLTEAAEAL
jgi:hypothetical protein